MCKFCQSSKIRLGLPSICQQMVVGLPSSFSIYASTLLWINLCNLHKASSFQSTRCVSSVLSFLQIQIIGQLLSIFTIGKYRFCSGSRSNLTNAQHTDRKIVYVFQIRLHTVLLLPNAIKKNVKTEVQVVNYRKYESKTAAASKQQLAASFWQQKLSKKKNLVGPLTNCKKRSWD